MQMDRHSRVEGSNNCLLDLPVLGKGKPTHIPGADEMVHGRGSFYKNKQPSIHELLSQYDELSVAASSVKPSASFSPGSSSKHSLASASQHSLDEHDDAHLGLMRASMKKNYVLARQHPKIGTVPPTTVSPASSTTKIYGRRNDFSDGGVPALINGVKKSGGDAEQEDEEELRQRGEEDAFGAATPAAAVGKKSRSKSRSKSSEVPRRLNYVEMNKRSVQHGLVSAKDQFRLRDAVQVEQTVTVGKPRPRAEAPKDGRSFGAPTSIDRTLPALMSHEYQREWHEKQLLRSKSEAELGLGSRKLAPLPITQTRATMLRQKVAEPEQPQALWKLSKFDTVGPAISTFRDESFRQRAMESHKSDGVARSGEQHHGIYIQ